MSNVSICMAGFLTAGVLSLSVSPAVAGSFRASYNFGPDVTDDFTFEFDGELASDGNTIDTPTSIGDFTIGESVFAFSEPLSDVTLGSTGNAPQLTLDGTGNNLHLAAISGSGRGFRITSSGFNIQNDDPEVVIFQEFNPSLWSVEELIEEPTTAIPTPALLPGLLSIGLAVIRKRNLEEINDV